MSFHVKEAASDAAHQLATNPKAQGAISAGLTALGGYNFIEAATSVLSLVSLVIGICVGIYAIVNARKASQKADKELILLDLQLTAAVIKRTSDEKDINNASTKEASHETHR